MEETFTFERGENKYTLPFNPELEGYQYSQCQCQYVKFKKTEGNIETEFRVYYKKDYIQVIKLRHEGSHFRQIENKNLVGYPKNQFELKGIIATV